MATKLVAQVEPQLRGTGAPQASRMLSAMQRQGQHRLHTATRARSGGPSSIPCWTLS